MATLAHCKATVPFLLGTLAEIQKTLEASQDAESVNGFLGCVLDQDQRLVEIAEDLRSLVRLAKRAPRLATREM